jgi:hypothetical protein
MLLPQSLALLVGKHGPYPSENRRSNRMYGTARRYYKNGKTLPEGFHPGDLRAC